LLVYQPSMTRCPTNPSCHSDVVREPYRRMAESLTFGNPLGRLGKPSRYPRPPASAASMHANPSPIFVARDNISSGLDALSGWLEWRLRRS
jgi:hypothetical protein